MLTRPDKNFTVVFEYHDGWKDVHVTFTDEMDDGTHVIRDEKTRTMLIADLDDATKQALAVAWNGGSATISNAEGIKSFRDTKFPLGDDLPHV